MKRARAQRGRITARQRRAQLVALGPAPVPDVVWRRAMLTPGPWVSGSYGEPGWYGDYAQDRWDGIGDPEEMNA